MAVVSIAAKDIMQRRQEIIRMITPLIADRKHIDVRQVGTGRNFTLGVLAKGQSPASINSADSIRIPSRVSGVFLNYYEVWVSDTTTTDLLLNRAYMHVHLKRTNDAPDRQILCLHCDPHLEKNDASFQYKRGPHLHIGGAMPNIDRSHVSVCLSDPNLGGLDLQAIMSTMKSAVAMINKEIFPSYLRA
jgi:hypothetical protein